MAKYTTSVRSICEVNSGLSESKGQANVNQIVESARSSIFDFDYPIYDEAYRPVLEKKILKHYYTREIGAETVGLWKLFLDTRMNEIMPYYNKLYQSELLQFNPLYDADYSKTYTREGEQEGSERGTLTGTSTDAVTGTVADEGDSRNTRTDNLTKTNNLSTGVQETDSERIKNDHWDYYSDTPQGSVGNLENLTYLTNARHITDDGQGSTKSVNSTTTNTGTVTDTGTQTNVGENDNTRTYNTLDTRNDSRTTTGTSSLNSTEEYVEHVVGKMPGHSYAKMIQEFRDTLLNIDMLIIRDLQDLFFGLWE